MLNTMDEIITKTRIALQKEPDQEYDILQELYMLGTENFEEQASKYCRKQGWTEPK